MKIDLPALYDWAISIVLCVALLAAISFLAAWSVFLWKLVLS